MGSESKKGSNLFIELNLLPYAKLAKTKDSMLWDPTRRKWIEQSPEELVRQGLIQFLHKEKNIAFSKMRSEYQVKFNKLRKRLDLIIYDQSGAPLLLAECKSWKVNLNHDTLKQIGVYNSVVQAPFILACDGNTGLLAKVNLSEGTTEVLSDWPELNNAKA